MMQWKDLKLWCPNCTKWVPVWAEAYQFELAEAPLVYYDHAGNPGDVSLDWDNLTLEAEYRYVCPEPDCQHVFGYGYPMDKLIEMMKEDIRVHGDPDKVEEHMPV